MGERGRGEGEKLDKYKEENRKGEGRERQIERGRGK